MASLQEMLEAKRQKTETALPAISEESSVPYTSVYKPSVDPTLLLSVYKLLILHPYTYNLQDFRELREFLLGPDQYILNTFPCLDTQRIFSLYLLHNPPKQPIDLHRLWLLLSTLDLHVPASYQTQIEDLIQNSL